MQWLSLLQSLIPYLLVGVGFFGWKWKHDRGILKEAEKNEELRRAEKMAKVLAIERPTSAELRASLRDGTF